MTRPNSLRALAVLLDQLRGEFPAIAWSLVPAVGERDEVIAAMAACAAAALPTAF